MAEITGSVSGDGDAARKLDRKADDAIEATERTTKLFGAQLQTVIRARASGRPGPRAQTGDYRRSITWRYARLPGVVTSVVGTNAPQGRRLEFGFAPGIAPQNGVDVLGRRFEQPPRPHFGPAADEVRPRYEAALRVAIKRAVEG